MEISLQYKLEDTSKIAVKILEYLSKIKLILFYGEIGAGKTTLIKEICKLLLIQDEISSPTFSIVNEYLTLNEQKIYHFDLYRLKTQEDLEGIGFSEYLSSKSLSIIEWPEIAVNYFAGRQAVIINLSHSSLDTRKITISI